jgi:cobalt-precorrin-7 (C5)-methyltransferase
MTDMDNKIFVISMGPGNKDLLTTEALKAIKNVDILIGAKKFEDYNLGKPLIIPEKLISDTIKEIYKNNDKKIGLLVTGDAGFYSLAKKIVDEFGRNKVKIIPGISVVQIAFSKICEPWQDVDFFSLHGRNNDDFYKIKKSEKFVILCDNKNNTKSVIKKLIDLINNYDLYVMENLSMDTEKIILIENIDDINKIGNESLSIIIGIIKSKI